MEHSNPHLSMVHFAKTKTETVAGSKHYVDLLEVL